MELFIQFLLGFVSIGLGLFLVFKPEATIEIQRQFYLKINWRIEPVSMAKEIRNTKWMGLFLGLVGAAVIVYCLISH